MGGQLLYDPSRDIADPLGVKGPVKVHISIYASLRLINTMETMHGLHRLPLCSLDGRDQRRFPGHRQVYLYLIKDFCDAFGKESQRRLVKLCPLSVAYKQWGLMRYILVFWFLRGGHQRRKSNGVSPTMLKNIPRVEQGRH